MASPSDVTAPAEAQPSYRAATKPVPAGSSPATARKGTRRGPPGHSRRARIWLVGHRQTLSALLFLGALLIAIGGDLHDLYWYIGFMSTVAGIYAPDHVDIPHFQYHALMPPTGLSLAVFALATPLALGPFRRGERWAWWALTLATFGYLAVKVWDSLTLYAHPAAIVGMAVPALAALALSVAPTNGHRPSGVSG